MNQQINLYQAVFAKKKELLSGANLLWLLAGLLLLGGIDYGLRFWQVQRLQQTLVQRQQALTAADERLAQLRRQFPPRTKSVELAQQVARLEERRRALQGLDALVGTELRRSAGGFSPLLQGLARQTMPGLWLRRIVLGAGGSTIQLEGSALQAQSVPRYLQQLTGEAVFAGREFARFSMQRSPEDARQIDFILQSEEGPGA